ncbi:Tn3 family transposase [Pseudonocardia alni]|uniref:Tn3 family transposase n=1 Tax=Pseudonocardia alni TaxID=33907 RepID=UPI0033E65567
MATRVFADEELERLRGFPEIGREELFRFFTLAPADVAFVDPGRGRGPADRLGLSVALCTLPWLGFVPDDIAVAPVVAVDRLAAQLGVDPGVLRHYGRRAKTRTDHLRLVAQYRGWRVPASLEFKELDEFLLARAMEHDSPTLLFRLACEYLISVHVIRPGPVTVLERVAHAREQAQRETYDRLAHELTEDRRAGLDGLLVVDPEIGMTRLRWLGTGPVEASPVGIKAEVAKLEFLRGLGADGLDVSVLPAERRRFLATLGRRLTAQALGRREPQRRYPILLTLVAQSATDVLDEVVSLFDQAVSAREGKAERAMRDALAERGRAGEDRQALLDELLAVITDPAIADEDIGGVIRGDRIGWARIRAAMAQAVPRLPRDHGHLGSLEVSSYGYLRQFTPQVLAAVSFAGGTAAAELLAAVEILRTLNATGARRVPADAPTGFVPTRWRGYLDTAHASGNASAYRHFWELCTLLGLRDGLRTGDVYVPGSRRYADPAAYLLTADQWSLQRASFCGLVGKSADPAVALAAVADELSGALGELEQVLAAGDGPVRLDDAGDLVISPLTAEDIPGEAVALKAELTDMLPFAPIVSLLIELDGRIGLLDCFTHAGGKQTRSPELKRNLIAVLLSHSTNLGLTRMADACGISYDILAWTAEWYVREETLRAANLAIIDHHQRMPLAEVFGTGTLSSSDGQRFPVRGKTTTGRKMTIHGGQVLSTYTHVTDQHTTYGTKVIVATKREAHYVLDEILGNATDIPITEHTTDTHGVTLVNFGLFDLLGLQLSPRIRDLGKITLHRVAAKARAETDYPHVGPLLTRRVNVELIAEHWDDLLRLAGSLKFGHATASLIVGKLSASSRQNALAAALKEYGALRRTIYATRYLSDPTYRRKISRQLNKGESLHALKRDLLYAHEGTVRARHLEQQTEQAWCLTLVTNAVVAWTTEYYGLAVDSMRAAGRRVEDDVLAHISPAHSENINFFGAIDVDIDGELAALGPSGYRPLRVRDTLF